MPKVNAVFRVCGGCANKINDVSLQEGDSIGESVPL